VRFFRIPRLVDELARYAAMQNKSTLLRQIAKADLLIIDDFGRTCQDFCVRGI
jgi:DNA replication protein DnaC